MKLKFKKNSFLKSVTWKSKTKRIKVCVIKNVLSLYYPRKTFYLEMPSALEAKIVMRWMKRALHPDLFLDQFIRNMKRKK